MFCNILDVTPIIHIPQSLNPSLFELFQEGYIFNFPIEFHAQQQSNKC